jgi:putative transposase
MAWKSVSSMEERSRFVLEAQIGFWNMTEHCERYGISRKTGYKWLKRFEAEGLQGMLESSRSPKHCPHRTPDEVVERIVAERRKHSKWGPKKIAEVLMRSAVEFKVPAPSTIGSILDREGLVRRRRRRYAAVTRWPAKLTQPQRANHVWGVDFKGWFRTLLINTKSVTYVAG